MATITRRTGRQYDEEVRSLLRGGRPSRNSPLVHARLTPESIGLIRALDPRIGSAGGFLVSESLAESISTALDAKSVVWNLCSQIITETNEDMIFAYGDDTANTASVVVPNAARSAGTDPSFFGAKNVVYTYTTGPILLPLEITQDSGIDIQAYVSDRLAERLRRSIDASCLTGTGASEPSGLVSLATSIASGATGTATTLGWADLNAVESAVGPAYKFGPDGRNVSRYIMADDVFQYVKGLVDGAGRQLWQGDPSGVTAGTIRGFQCSIDDAMPALGASNKSVIFGDLSRAAILRIVRDMRLVTFAEHYMINAQTGVLAEMDIGFSVVNRGAYAVFQHSAS